MAGRPSGCGRPRHDAQPERPPIPTAADRRRWPQPDARLTLRVAALQAAATFCGGKALSTEVSTADVLKVAAAFDHWLLRQER